MKASYKLDMDGHGKITLPKIWRDKISVSKLLATESGNQLILRPWNAHSGLNMITGNASFDFLSNEPDLY